MSDPLTAERLEELERLAREVDTPGPWVSAYDEVSGFYRVKALSPVEDRENSDVRWVDEPEYTAAAHPTAVLALIARIRELENRSDDR
jgi:hypothetical protein